MKVTKNKKVTACMEISPTATALTGLECAKAKIKEAIDCLATEAATSDKAKDCIANLAVVLLDMTNMD